MKIKTEVIKVEQQRGSGAGRWTGNHQRRGQGEGHHGWGNVIAGTGAMT